MRRCNPKCKGYLPTGLEIGTDIGIRYFLPEWLISFNYLDFFELIRLQGLLAHTRRRDVKVITIMMPDAHIAIPAGDPVTFVGFDQGFTDGF